MENRNKNSLLDSEKYKNPLKERFNVIRKIGEGAHSRIYLAVNKSD